MKPIVLGGVSLLCLAAAPATAHASGDGHAWEPHYLSTVFFALLLASIAILPLLRRTAHWWEHNTSKAVLVVTLSIPVIILASLHAPGLLLHAGVEYVQFVSLLVALFVVSSGIHVTGDLRPTPAANLAVLCVGFVLASIVGTTGASVLLIYLLLRMNKERARKTHTFVFFIVVVSNMGGLLTPLGDPPLFIGFLRGIPFFWWLQRLWWVWLCCGGYVLGLYYVVDCYHWRRERAMVSTGTTAEPLGIIGAYNLLLLGAILAATLLAPSPLREIVYWGAAGTSLLYSSHNPTAKEARTRNQFSTAPIVEVLVLFAGIFVTMVPALQLLKLHGADLGLTEPWQYFCATGGFSSVLDNAPTFVIFTEAGMATGGAQNAAHFAQMFPHLLAAISLGAVFMGANTYVGNAPNFMVKAVAESQGIPMPNFFAYVLWALGILGPLYLFVIVVLPYVR